MCMREFILYDSSCRLRVSQIRQVKSQGQSFQHTIARAWKWPQLLSQSAQCSFSKVPIVNTSLPRSETWPEELANKLLRLDTLCCSGNLQAQHLTSIYNGQNYIHVSKNERVGRRGTYSYQVVVGASARARAIKNKVVSVFNLLKFAKQPQNSTSYLSIGVTAKMDLHGPG